MGIMVTLEEISRFSMDAFRRHGQAYLTDALVILNRGEPEVVGVEEPGGRDIEGRLRRSLEQNHDRIPNAIVSDEPFFGGNTEQLLQDLAPIYERLENAAGRSEHAIYLYLRFCGPETTASLDFGLKITSLTK